MKTASRNFAIKLFSFIDNKDLIMALSGAAVAIQVPKDPFGQNLYLTISLYGFAFFAALNHLFPTKFQKLTHVVKAFYTQLIYASIGIKGYAILFPVAISLIDLQPLFTTNEKQNKIYESMGFGARALGIIFGFFLIEVYLLIPLLLLYIPCTLAYYLERRDRIKQKHRHLYGISHHFEHLAIFFYFLCLNFDKINIPLMGYLGIIVVLFGLLFPGISHYLVNFLVYREFNRSIPSWFDPALLPELRKKMEGNFFSAKVMQYIIKVNSPLLINRVVSWKEIENLIAAIEVNGKFDLAIGIHSGGAFITKKVCEKLNIDNYYYCYSKNWSCVSLYNLMRKCFLFMLDKKIDIEAFSLSYGDQQNMEEKISKRRILLIDDTTCSGTTMRHAVKELYRLGALEVNTYALYCTQDYVTDYYYSQSRIPTVWPWGFEAD